MEKYLGMGTNKGEDLKVVLRGHKTTTFADLSHTLAAELIETTIRITKETIIPEERQNCYTVASTQKSPAQTRYLGTYPANWPVHRSRCSKCIYQVTNGIAYSGSSLID